MSFTESEKRYIAVINSNIRYHNGNRQKGILGIKFYVNDGNRASLTKDGYEFVVDMTIEQAYFAVAAIINYNYKGVENIDI